MPEANPSLKWRLSWQLSLVFVAVVAAVIVGLSIYGAMILSPNIAVARSLANAIADAASLDVAGDLRIADTPELRSLKRENEKLWFIATTTDGRTSSYGTVPAAFAELAHHANLFYDADFRVGSDATEIASAESAETEFGEIRVLFGRVAEGSSPFLTLLQGTYRIYVPLLGLALPAIFIAVPRIVGRGLAGVRDVARKSGEIDLRRRGSRLSAKGIPSEVEPLVLAFNGVLERLEQEFFKRQRFLVDAAHELRTPIAIMQTGVEAMEPGPERSRLLGNVGRLAATAEQLLALERNEQDDDIHQPLDLVELTRGVVADLAPIAIASGYEIAFHDEGMKVERQGNAFKLARAVSNLVCNAIDHGGGTGLIAVSVSAGGAITVSDEGPGIPVDQRELIFEPFYRVKPRSTGAGLGLSLSKQIVESHRGRLTVDGDASGTRMTIQL